MTNKEIAQQFKLMSKLLEVHQQDAFRAKSYSIAAYHIEQLPQQASDMDPDLLLRQKGIGAKTGARILEILETGQTMSVLQEWIDKTPAGVLEMLEIKGLGAKKIGQIWKEMGIETLGELDYACHENRLLDYKGFGAKTQDLIRKGIAYYQKNQGLHLYASVIAEGKVVMEKLSHQFPGHRWEFTGPLRRQAEIIAIPEILTDLPIETWRPWVAQASLEFEEWEDQGRLRFFEDGLIWHIHFASPETFTHRWWHTTGDEVFLASLPPFPPTAPWRDESEYFEQHRFAFIPPALREESAPYAAYLNATTPPPLIAPKDIRGVIHTHTQWSDGSHRIIEMATYARNAGYEYLVISDHSRSATYAKGLNLERLAAQIQEIDEVNALLHPFVVFKSIESDILGDGSLDYPDEILAKLDLVIASIHSNLNMSEERAMARITKALENPYTTILGHPTGRLLLSRPGYPIDHKALIDLCAQHQVVLELNAHPKRLDLDWRWIPYAQEKGVLLSINPDAHSTAGIHDLNYGVLAAQKGGLSPQGNLSSLSLEDFKQFLAHHRARRMAKKSPPLPSKNA